MVKREYSQADSIFEIFSWMKDDGYKFVFTDLKRNEMLFLYKNCTNNEIAVLFDITEKEVKEKRLEWGIKKTNLSEENIFSDEILMNKTIKEFSYRIQGAELNKYSLFENLKLRKGMGEFLDFKKITCECLDELWYIECHTDKEIGELYGVSKDTVYLKRREFGILITNKAVDKAVDQVYNNLGVYENKI